MTTIFINYKPAKVYKNGNGHYIEYSIVHPETNKLKRKRISLNGIPYRERKAYAKKQVADLNIRLAAGWSPFRQEIEDLNNVSFSFALDEYQKIKKRELRRLTFRLYSKNIRILQKYVNSKKIYNIREFTKIHAKNLLNYLYLDFKWSEVTYINSNLFALLFGVIS